MAAFNSSPEGALLCKSERNQNAAEEVNLTGG